MKAFITWWCILQSAQVHINKWHLLPSMSPSLVNYSPIHTYRVMFPAHSICKAVSWTWTVNFALHVRENLCSNVLPGFDNCWHQRVELIKTKRIEHNQAPKYQPVIIKAWISVQLCYENDNENDTMCYLDTFLSSPTSCRIRNMQLVPDDTQIQIMLAAICFILFLELIWRCSLTKMNIRVLIKGGVRLRWRSAPVNQKFEPKIIWGNGWYDGQDEKTKKRKIICLKLELSKIKFLVRGVEVAQEIWPLENSPSKKCCLIDNYVIISFFSCLKFSTGEVLAMV